MKTQILSLILAGGLFAADSLTVPDVERPKIKLPEGWLPPTDPPVMEKLDFSTLAAGGGSGFATFTAYDPSILAISFANKWTVSDGWLTIHPGSEDQSWKMEDVLIETKHKPVVTKIGDRWVIRFKRG